MTRLELQILFYEETGIECFNSQGEPDIDYVQWLETKIIEQKNIISDEEIKKEFQLRFYTK